jgi:hypothetical protein
VAKPAVYSWDVFDCLIARRCVHPNEIFELMGRTLGYDFKVERLQAESEARADKPDLSIADIYDKLQARFHWSEGEKQRVLDLEIQTEFENVIPIAENISRVRDGDILVSDMYLPAEVIMRLLRAAGLNKQVTLFVSGMGKADGTMWRSLKGQYRIIRHTGDNPRSDFLRPLRYGIFARMTETSAETRWEQLLRFNGAPALSAYVREKRLRLDSVTGPSHKSRRAQIEANFPLLLLASAALIRWCNQQGYSSALMCSRDCVLWAPLAAKVADHAGGDIKIEYFLTSRVAALKSSENFLNYASKRVKPDAVVVDLSMTGVSLAGLADRLGMTQVSAFVISWQRSSAKSLYGDAYRPKARVSIEFLTAEVIDEDLEALNQATTPSIHDVQELGEELSITYATENRSQSILDAVQVQNAAFEDMLKTVPTDVLDEALKLALGMRLVFLVRECARHAGSFKTVTSMAQPGAALWNDPNGIMLNLPYAKQGSFLGSLFYKLKRLARHMVPAGSPQHRLAKLLAIVIQIAKDRMR